MYINKSANTPELGAAEILASFSGVPEKLVSEVLDECFNKEAATWYCPHNILLGKSS